MEKNDELWKSMCDRCIEDLTYNIDYSSAISCKEIAKLITQTRINDFRDIYIKTKDSGFNRGEMFIFKNAGISDFKTILSEDDQTLLCSSLINIKKIDLLTQLILLKPKFNPNFVASLLFNDEFCASDDFALKAADRLFCIALMIKMGYKFFIEPSHRNFYIAGILSVFNRNELKMADLVGCGIFSDQQLELNDFARLFYPEGPFELDSPCLLSLSDEKLKKYLPQDFFSEDDLEILLLDALNFDIISMDSMRECNFYNNAFSRAMDRYEQSENLDKTRTSALQSRP